MGSRCCIVLHCLAFPFQFFIKLFVLTRIKVHSPAVVMMGQSISRPSRSQLRLYGGMGAPLALSFCWNSQNSWRFSSVSAVNPANSESTTSRYWSSAYARSVACWLAVTRAAYDRSAGWDSPSLSLLSTLHISYLRV